MTRITNIKLYIVHPSSLCSTRNGCYQETAPPFWGWKDPRTTLTLPLWLKLFPKARIIHVIRNGIDSALSLWRRCKKAGVGAPHCLDLNYCFDLLERSANCHLQQIIKATVVLCAA
ncbi:MAG: sulfotransferase [Deltaproteobacteria bacterium]|nr:sulfotransferase [Deltaproteobacteria bacterium]